MKEYCLVSKRIITPEGILDGRVVIKNGKIDSVLGKDKSGFKELPAVDVGSDFVSPGFIDIHVHGGGGHDFMDGTLECIKGAAKLHLGHGTTSMVPTTLTSTDDELYHSIDNFKAAKKQIKKIPHLLGMHLEGPYFSLEMCGAQDPAYIKEPDSVQYKKIIDKADGAVVRWSVAPELPGAPEMGSYLRENGIVASMGHSNAEYDEVLRAYEHGFTLLTHFYSAMSTIVRKDGFRHLGMIESGYILEDLDVEIIADGCHLPYELLEMIHRYKGTSHTALVTDAMRGAGITSGYTILGSLKKGQKVLIEDGVAKLLDRSAFAGSIATCDRLVRSMIKAGVSLHDAVSMMTSTPARIMGIEDRAGAISAGMDADIVVFDNDINIKRVFLCGEEIDESLSELS